MPQRKHRVSTGRPLSCHVLAPAAAKTETSFRAHQQCQQSLSSTRHESVRSPVAGSPFCARSLLMGLNNRSINHRIFEVWRTVYGTEKTLKHTGISPSAEPFENRIPIAEILGQIAPRRACSHTPKNRLYEPTIVPATCTWVTNFPGLQRPHLLPKFI